MKKQTVYPSPTSTAGVLIAAGYTAKDHVLIAMSGGAKYRGYIVGSRRRGNAATSLDHPNAKNGTEIVVELDSGRTVRMYLRQLEFVKAE